MTAETTTPAERLIAAAREAQALAADATPGPWAAQHCHVYRTADDDAWSGLGLVIHGPPEPSMHGQFELGADARFIAASRHLVPALAAAVITLAEAGWVLADEIAAYREGWSDWEAVAAAWEAHQDALEQAATEMEEGR